MSPTNRRPARDHSDRGAEGIHGCTQQCVPITALGPKKKGTVLINAPTPSCAPTLSVFSLLPHSAPSTPMTLPLLSRDPGPRAPATAAETSSARTAMIHRQALRAMAEHTIGGSDREVVAEVASGAGQPRKLSAVPDAGESVARSDGFVLLVKGFERTIELGGTGWSFSIFSLGQRRAASPTPGMGPVGGRCSR